jgi:hypothetical protein
MSKRVLTQIEALRTAMAGADGGDDGSFGQVFNAFLDIAGERTLFNLSEPAKATDIQGILEVAARQLTRDETTDIQGLRLLRIAQAGFLHGGFVAGGYMGTFFYFEKDQQGLVAFTRGMVKTYISRITLTDLPEGAFFSPAPKGPQ